MLKAVATSTVVVPLMKRAYTSGSQKQFLEGSVLSEPKYFCVPTQHSTSALKQSIRGVSMVWIGQPMLLPGQNDHIYQDQQVDR